MTERIIELAEGWVDYVITKHLEEETRSAIELGSKSAEVKAKQLYDLKNDPQPYNSLDDEDLIQRK